MIPLWDSYVPPCAYDAAKRVLSSGWLNTGSEERAFRAEFASAVGARYAVPTINGTMALKMALVAAGVRPGDEVLTTPYTFLATNTAILEVGAVPVFCDIDYDTLCIDRGAVANRMRGMVRAIMAVDYGGYPAASDVSVEYVRMGVPVIFDSAHGIGTTTSDIRLGARLAIITYSLQAVKVITSGDGGVVCTQDPDMADRLQRLSWYGVDRTVAPTEPDRMPEDITELGFKANMNDLTAAIARAGLSHLDEVLARRRWIGEAYRRELNGLQKTRLLRYDSWVKPNYQIFPVHVHDRPAFWKHMRERGIQTAVNNRRNDRYSIFGGWERDLPNTARADEDTILIPIHMGLSDSDVDQVIESVREYDRL